MAKLFAVGFGTLVCCVLMAISSFSSRLTEASEPKLNTPANAYVDCLISDVEVSSGPDKTEVLISYFDKNHIQYKILLKKVQNRPLIFIIGQMNRISFNEYGFIDKIAPTGVKAEKE